MSGRKRTPTRDRARAADREPDQSPSDFAPQRAPRRGARVRKNMDMDQAKLDAAKRILGVRTETEAVDAALDLVAFQAEVFAGIDRAAESGGFADIYDE